MFGSRVMLRRVQTESGEEPHLTARMGINRAVLPVAAGSISGCVISGSGGVMWAVPSVPQSARLK